MEGKHVVVTGATGGLGSAVVAALLDRGATVHVPMVEEALPRHLPWASAARVVATPRVALDDESAVTAYYGALPGVWASVHLVGGFAMAPITSTSLADLGHQMSLNVNTTFLCCREAVRAMQKAGGGRIVNVAARPALSPVGGMIAYSMAKAAVASLTQCLAAEVLADGILVNAIVPSIIDTPANRAAMPSANHENWPTPAQIASTIGFLVSPENALTSGAMVPVYGRG